MKSLLVSTAVALLLSGAPAAWAQPDNRDGGKHQDRPPNARQEQAGKDEHGHRGAAPAQVQAAPAPAQVQPAPVQAPVQAQATPERHQGRQAQDRFQGPVQAPVQAAPVQAPVQAQARPERQQGPQAQRFDRQQRQANPQDAFRAQPQAAPQVQAFRNTQAVPPRHVEQRNQWQSSNQNWNRGTVWQRDPNWWRGNNAFRNYSGVRLNFYFAPGFGYYSVPRQYWRHSWHPGEYLPRYFMRYVVDNYRSYGLPRPPRNCSWIWVNNSILLVDRSDRYILDEVSNVW